MNSNRTASSQRGSFAATTTDVEAEARRLRAAWDDALTAYRRNDTDANYEAEDRAHDALIDYIEANGLNYTEHDPRGTDG